MRFVGGVLIWSIVGAVVIRVLMSLGLGFRGGRSQVGRVEVIRRRDRSLGGKEVVIERRAVDREESWSVDDRGSKAGTRSLRRREEKKLPNWWPVINPIPVYEGNKEEYQRHANKIIQGLFLALCI